MAEYVDSNVTLQAIKLLNPDAAVSVNDDPNYKNDAGEWEEQISYAGVYWPPSATEATEQPQFTLEEIRAKYPEAEKIVNNNNIRRTRELEYGRIQDQLDKLYHDIDAGKLDETGEWFKSIKAVKDANPLEE